MVIQAAEALGGFQLKNRTDIDNRYPRESSLETRYFFLVLTCTIRYTVQV